MKRAVTAICLAICAGGLAFSQPAEAPPRFEAADVSVSPKSPNQFFRTLAHGVYYDIKNATMVDLIRTAYDFDADKVLGGPNWLEMDRFDVRTKLPEDSTADTRKLMLQSLLADRFKVVVHKDTRPLPAYALVAGKKPVLKEADGAGESGCKLQTASGPPPEGGVRLMTMSSNGAATTINLGPGMMIQYECRNITMASFAAGLPKMMGANALGSNAVLDETRLEGKWNFDVRWSLQLIGPAMMNSGDRITVFDAVEKQLGLKLEEKQVPTPVIVVESVNQKPLPNPPETAKLLPEIPAPTEFEVASVKPTDPDARMGFSTQMQPGGRYHVQGMPLRFLVSQAFGSNNRDQIVGLPTWADSERFDVTAKAPSEGPSSPPLDNETVAPMLLSLLKDRFKLAYHTEDRPASTYTLVAGKPKLKKADPASRTFCKTPQPPQGSPPGSRVLNCQNVTMAQFAERLQFISPELSWPVADGTGLEGGWDFTVTFSFGPMFFAGMPRGGDAAAAAPVPTAADPTQGLTIFEAIEKQLGLKLTMLKRPMPVIVIDHIEQKPTEN